MKTFAGIALPVFVVIWTAALIGGFAIASRQMGQGLKRRRERVRAPLRKRLAARCREILGTPWAIPGDGEPLTEAEMRVFASYVTAEQEKRPCAPEPQYRRQR